MRRRSLKDLFVSSPGGEDDVTNDEIGNSSVDNMGLAGPGYAPGSPRPVGSGFRCRSLLSKRAWRPVLVTIAE